MKNIFRRFNIYRIFLLISIIFFLVLFFLFIFKKPAFPHFISYLFIISATFILITFLVAIAGISDSIELIRDIQKMLDFTKKIKNGNFDINLAIKRNDELGKLAKNLELMKTSLKSSFHEILKEKEKFSSIFQNITEGIIVFSEDRRISLLNPFSEKILGWKREELINKKYFEVLKFLTKKNEEKKNICQKLNDKECPIEKAVLTKQQVSIPENIFLVNKYGNEIEISGSIFPFVSKDGVSSFALVFRDVTSEKEIERMKSEFISITSHQLRTPLSSIRWYVEMLLAGDAGPLKEKQKEFLEDIHDSTITAIGLINNLLDVQRIESGRMTISMEDVSVVDIAKQVISDLTPIALAANAKIIAEFEENLPKIKADPKKLVQVFSNIISNAIQYNKGRGPIIVKVKKTNKDIIFSCKDNGIGIPKEEQRYIFKKFYRASNTAGVGTPGSGIGLYICRVYTEQMNGKIWFESKGVNKGTTFYVSLPIA